MKRTIFTLLMLLAATTLPAQRYGEDFSLKIWDNATAPHSNGLTGGPTDRGGERIGNTTEALLYIFKADEAKATGQAVVICPGGGYQLLAMRHEGYQMARWFADNGITAAVLQYRMPNGHPEVPLEDAEQALRIMAGLEAGATGCTADKVGIAGFSAGGHLAAMASTKGGFRPAFSILFYPVITSDPACYHSGSFDSLLGKERSDELSAAYSLENCVDAQTPPALLLLSDDDKTVPPLSSTRYYDALKRRGIPASIHIWPKGGHGWGMEDRVDFKPQWQQITLDWLAALNGSRQ